MTEAQRQAARDNLARARLAKEAKAAPAAAPPDDGPAVVLPEPSDDPVQLEPPPRDDRRLRLLEGIDPDIAALISDDELDHIEAEERKKAQDERKKKALGTVRDQMRQRARVENDLISSDVLRSDDEKRRLAELVRFKITLPNDGSGDPKRGRNGFRVDGRLFQQGAIYTESRAVFESLQSNHYRAWLAEYQFKTLDQHKPGNEAIAALGARVPQFELVR